MAQNLHPVNCMVSTAATMSSSSKHRASAHISSQLDNVFRNGPTS